MMPTEKGALPICCMQARLPYTLLYFFEKSVCRHPTADKRQQVGAVHVHEGKTSQGAVAGGAAGGVEDSVQALDRGALCADDLHFVVHQKIAVDVIADTTHHGAVIGPIRDRHEARRAHTYSRRPSPLRLRRRGSISPRRRPPQTGSRSCHTARPQRWDGRNHPKAIPVPPRCQTCYWRAFHDNAYRKSHRFYLRAMR